MEKFYEELPNKLRKFGLSQKDFGRMIGVGQSTISAYTTGRAVPSAIVDKMIKTTVKELEKKDEKEIEKSVKAGYELGRK